MYDKLRDHQRWVLPEVLAYQARVRGTKAYITTVDGETLTYAEAEAQAAKVAGFYASLGVQPGDTVAVMMPNGLDFVRTWLGLGRLGAILVALNTDLKGAFLEHQMRNSGAKVALFHASLLPALQDIADRLPELKTVVVAGDPVQAVVPGWRLVKIDEWCAASAYEGPLPKARDIASVIYTSGTTGPSKGVLLPHAHCFLFGLGEIENHAMTEEDRFYVVMPMFHVNGLYLQLYATMIAGATAVMRPRFSASSWLPDVRQHRITITNMLGAMAAFIHAVPPSPADRDHCLRIIQTAPNPPEHDRIWRERFGVPEVLSGFGMTEVNICCYGPIGRSRPGTCGVVYDRYFEVEIRDSETDEPVPRGTVGEIMVRPKVPFGFMAGYHKMPEKTVEAWRNFWFHTGDAATMDQDGYVIFLDRIKDCIRRRGENISSFEVEAAIGRFPGVKEVAAYAVPSTIEGAEDEVMLAVVAEPGVTLDMQALVRHADRELPRFAQPRFIEIMDSLPKTPTARVQKAKLRQRGVTAATWDREAASKSGSIGA
jgi:crotonobetaine/carnitine-CoA ligase